MTRSEAAEITAIANVLHGIAQTMIDGHHLKTPQDFARLVQDRMLQLAALAEPAMLDAETDG